jgi:hypothetical protein
MSPAGPFTMVGQSKKEKFPFTGCLDRHLISQGHIFTWGQNWVSYYKWIDISLSKIQFYRPLYCCRYCPIPSNYAIEQRFYMDVKCSVPGPFYLRGCRCSAIEFKLCNRTHLAHGCKMQCTRHFTAAGGDTLVYSNYGTEQSCTWT